MFKRIVPLLMAGYTLWQCAAWLQREVERRRNASPAKPREVMAWEGEGGALRGSGSQLGPAPAQP
jgi:hypothetical protein